MGKITKQLEDIDEDKAKKLFTMINTRLRRITKDLVNMAHETDSIMNKFKELQELEKK